MGDEKKTVDLVNFEQWSPSKFYVLIKYTVIIYNTNREIIQ